MGIIPRNHGILGSVLFYISIGTAALQISKKKENNTNKILTATTFVIRKEMWFKFHKRFIKRVTFFTNNSLILAKLQLAYSI